VTCHRRYTFTYPIEVGHGYILRRLRQACEEYWWYSDPQTLGNGLGVLQVRFNVAARDQWWAHKRAMNLMENAIHGLGVDLPIPTPDWETLTPHTNRGRHRVSR
jgi:hypothetical protein